MSPPLHLAYGVASLLPSPRPVGARYRCCRCWLRSHCSWRRLCLHEPKNAFGSRRNISSPCPTHCGRERSTRGRSMGRWAPAEAIASASAGSAIAVEALLVAIWPACFRLAIMVTGDRGLAEDATQEACVIVHRKVRGLRRVEAFDAWLYRIVMHESTKVRRRSGRVAEQIDRSTTTDGTMSVDVWRALGGLSPELRAVTVLYYFHDLTGEEIAAALRVSHGAVRVRLTRAREALRALLGDYDFEQQQAQLKVQHYAV